jgi:hypothetical protein
MKAGDRPALRIIKRSADRRISPPSERRFPPVVQVLTLTAPHIQERLQDIAMIGYRSGLDSEEICEELHTYARALGYDVTIGVQEVRTDEMPSFRGETVLSTLMLVDLQVAELMIDPSTLVNEQAS